MNNKTKTKTYRVKAEYGEEAEKKAIEFVTTEKELITEAEIINICIKIGLKQIKKDDVREFIKGRS